MNKFHFKWLVWYSERTQVPGFTSVITTPLLKHGKNHYSIYSLVHVFLGKSSFALCFVYCWLEIKAIYVTPASERN